MVSSSSTALSLVFFRVSGLKETHFFWNFQVFLNHPFGVKDEDQIAFLFKEFLRIECPKTTDDQKKKEPRRKISVATPYDRLLNIRREYDSSWPSTILSARVLGTFVLKKLIPSSFILFSCL